ncbi:MAG: hypothetical protein K0R09_3901 [Clostridiales bacterium]|jgi:hypothetical protein|nr:hypothetical protein [Clostridiales bacterium]
MTDIMGIELRKINIEVGDDHEKITAKVYIDSIKAGELINDGWCDEFYIEFTNMKMMNRFKEIMYKFYKKRKIDSSTPDFMINELLRLNKQYKGVKDSTLSNCYQISFI